MKARLLVSLLLALSLAAAAVSGAAVESKRHKHPGGAHQAELELPDRLDLPQGWQPEGIAAGRRFDLYVGSIPTGAVLRLDARTGATEIVVPGGPGRAAIGLKLDHRKRLFVAGATTGKAFVYGAELAQFQLSVPGQPSFVNDVVLTRRTAYFTDSQRSAIYAVDTRLRRARTIELPDIPNEPGNNLNGIVATPDGGTLLAVQTNAGRLVEDRPGGGQRGPGRPRGTIGSTGFGVPTTIAFLRGELYAVNARFGTADPQPAAYWVTLVRR